MNCSLNKLLIFTLGTIFGVSLLITYANSYNSEEISYDNSKSGAEADNVKDAIDWLYENGGIKGECPEDMTCIESPIVTINVEGPGSVDKESMYVRINESNTFTVTPNEEYVLASIICDNGYTLSSFSIGTGNTALNPQEITITNPGVITGSTCTVRFSSNEIIIQSSEWSEVGTSGGHDTCNSSDINCACWFIKKGGNNFSYLGHTGCNFISKTCKYATHNGGSSFNCDDLYWLNNYNCWSDYSAGAACSGVITCET